MVSYMGSACRAPGVAAEPKGQEERKAMARKMRRLLASLLGLVLALGVVLGIAPREALADDAIYYPASNYDGYGALATGDDTVYIDGVKDIGWYVIGYDADAKTVTLLAMQTVDNSAFNSTGTSNAYAGSTIEAKVKGLTGEGQLLAEIASVLANVNVANPDVSGVVPYLLSSDEANQLSDTKRTGNGVDWWLRSPSGADSTASYVSYSGTVQISRFVGDALGVRPAIKLDLTSVAFSSDTKTFSLAVPVTGVTLEPSDAQTIDVGGTVKFAATVTPEDATDKAVKWSVDGSGVTLYSDEDCKTALPLDAATETLTVYAKGMSVGSAAVTVTSNADSEMAATCEVKVVKPAPEVKITAQPKDLNLTYGYTDTHTLTVSVEEIDGYDLIYQWLTCTDRSGNVPDDIEGATSSSYTIPKNLNVGVTYYYCDINAVSREGGKTGVAESAVVAVTVSKAAPTMTEPTAKTLTYSGSAQELVNAGSTKDGTMQYALGTATEATGSYSTSIPTATNAGTYYVWYKVVGDGNHNDSEAKCVTVTIAMGGDPAPTKPTYAATTGSGSEYAEGSDGTLTFVFKRSEGDEKTFEHFRSASVDGRSLTRDRDYTATSGSVVITLQPAYLATLAAGEHTLTATFDDGSAEVKFTVKKDPFEAPTMSNVKGGDFVSLKDEITFTVTQKVPAEAKSLHVWADLDSPFDLVGGESNFKVTDASGNPVKAEINLLGRTLSVKVADATPLHGGSLVITYVAKVREGADLKEYLNPAGNVASIPYQAHATFNGDEDTVYNSVVEYVKFRVSKSSGNDQTPKTPQAPQSKTPTTAAKPSLPKTGDPTSLATAAMLAATGAAFAAAGARRRRRDQ